jgi:hypothetical protein
LQIFTHALGRVISPGQKPWHTLSGIEFSCSLWEVQDAPRKGHLSSFGGQSRWGEVRWGEGEGRRGEGGGVGFYFWILMFPMCSLQVSLAFLTCSSDFQCVPQDVPNSIFFIPYIYIYIYI